ncbi:NADH-ubiquinone oxidoreductase 9.5 kDa subunit [Penicillium manginii]|uniref:NADH-ubiquinone oxidoreductase 9.5 kDa subunit n=1 Tax=Penicillium manginii TaxID=203109 RepID=UPI002548EAC9|nr:NADH-ubiquinone oxidoreductase 9.5 kDa subunit [Penicillium manginii]KAJ5742949.1 NADH-ubiquinone oxidoreductase 9.5 kDa subunit [Penicillium manginii]
MFHPHLWKQPGRWMRWAAHEKPAIFFSCLIGISGPIMLAALPPVRRALGDYDPAPIPMSYPIPSGPRSPPKGYEDE